MPQHSAMLALINLTLDLSGSNCGTGHQGYAYSSKLPFWKKRKDILRKKDETGDRVPRGFQH